MYYKCINTCNDVTCTYNINSFHNTVHALFSEVVSDLRLLLKYPLVVQEIFNLMYMREVNKCVVSVLKITIWLC